MYQEPEGYHVTKEIIQRATDYVADGILKLAFQVQTLKVENNEKRKMFDLPYNPNMNVQDLSASMIVNLVQDILEGKIVLRTDQVKPIEKKGE